ncbi:TIGR01906 family membrane protein [Tindallia californiensis]|uniref:Integral membrane protein TIGR01906 n=1 Tax=Tindallia californiensis TaxID=159292 RepID=A0A1H3KIP6_9FIRM|nr:TIGR01906 family membrane protein [Tindallia californiensis]SDY51655.1 integral membrane protein TIGR01906 [Tindallia californiensis]
MKWKTRIIYLLMGIFLTVVAWVTALEYVSYDVEHYMTEFEKQDWVPQAGMDRENLKHTAEEIILYLQGEKEDFQTMAVKGGIYQPLFDERERLHMIDVLELYDSARLLRNISIIGLLLLLAWVVYQDNKWKNRVLRTLFFTGLANVDMMILLGLLIWLDFTKYFTYFHLLLFDNDLWILNPQHHVLIQLLPESFFINTAIKIGLYAMGSLFALGIIAWQLEKMLFRYQAIRNEHS